MLMFMLRLSLGVASLHLDSDKPCQTPAALVLPADSMRIGLPLRVSGRGKVTLDVSLAP